MKILVVVILVLLLLFLVRRNYLQVDLTFPLFAGLILLGVASLSTDFIDWIAALLNIAVAPRAIILITIAILLAIITVLAIALSRLRQRQIMIVRFLAQQDLERQQSKLDQSSTTEKS